jgi:hypothetical protein
VEDEQPPEGEPCNTTTHHFVFETKPGNARLSPYLNSEGKHHVERSVEPASQQCATHRARGPVGSLPAQSVSRRTPKQRSGIVPTRLVPGRRQMAARVRPPWSVGTSARPASRRKDHQHRGAADSRGTGSRCDDLDEARRLRGHGHGPGLPRAGVACGRAPFMI